MQRVLKFGGVIEGTKQFGYAEIVIGGIPAARKFGGFIVRKSAKKHGMQRLIEGPTLPKGSRVILVDDVATTGGSLVEAKKALNKQGVKVDCAIVIVDREEGATENLTRAGCRLISLFKKKDIL